MKALIIDDERLARYELRRLLAEHPATCPTAWPRSRNCSPT